MDNLKQSDRLMQFSTPAVGQDVLLIKAFEAVEEISRLFEFRAVLLAATAPRSTRRSSSASR